MKLANDNYTIYMGTKKFTERYYKDSKGWLKISAKGNVFRMTAEQVLNHLLPAVAGVKPNLIVKVEHNTHTRLVTELIEFIQHTYSPEEKIKQSKNGAETIFFRKSGKSLCYIEINNEKTTVVIVIGTTLSDKVQLAPVSEKAKKMFLEAKQFHDGKWLFFEVKTKGDINDIKTLLLIKKMPKYK